MSGSRVDARREAAVSFFKFFKFFNGCRAVGRCIAGQHLPDGPYPITF
jgi:hypothetical protein